MPRLNLFSFCFGGSSIKALLDLFFLQSTSCRGILLLADPETLRKEVRGNCYAVQGIALLVVLETDVLNGRFSGTSVLVPKVRVSLWAKYDPNHFYTNHF